MAFDPFTMRYDEEEHKLYSGCETCGHVEAFDCTPEQWERFYKKGELAQNVFKDVPYDKMMLLAGVGCHWCDICSKVNMRMIPDEIFNTMMDGIVSLCGPKTCAEDVMTTDQLPWLISELENGPENCEDKKETVLFHVRARLVRAMINEAYKIVDDLPEEDVELMWNEEGEEDEDKM